MTTQVPIAHLKIPRTKIEHPYFPPVNEDPFFTDFYGDLQAEGLSNGLADLDWEETAYPYCALHKEAIIELFDMQYKYREISQETLNKWNNIMNIRMRVTLPKYERAFELYDTKDINKVALGYIEVLKNKGNTTASVIANVVTKDNGSINEVSNGKENNESKGTSTNKTTLSSEVTETFKDTPTSTSSVLNEPTNKTITDTEGTQAEDGTNTVTESNTKEDELTRTTEDERVQTSTNDSDGASESTGYNVKDVYDEVVISTVNKLIDKWRNLEMEFVNEFESCFIGVFTLSV